MIRGSTPTHEFNIPFDTSLIEKLEIVYAQNDKVVFQKNTEDCTLDGQTIYVTLSQEETIKFDCYKRSVQIQLRVKTTDERVVISNLMSVDLQKCLFDGVI